ncbi:MAG: DUF5777 family beta-barrel protein [Bacteroidales bacterium]|nr:DUF5777 family beta-barrel protein [Bacteroidales bacterium]
MFIILGNTYSLLFAQEQSESTQQPKRYAKQTFRSTRFITVPTTKMHPKGGFEFGITHRFGYIDFDEPVFKDFFGLDLSSNIRFGFAFPIHKRVYVGVGRTKFDKNYDFEINAVLLKQTRDNKQPVSISLYHNTAFMSNDFPEVGKNMFNADTTEFSYKPIHRFAYYTQLSIARKFGSSFSAQVSPAIIYRNLTPSSDYENLMLSVPVCARLKVSIQGALILETIPVVYNKPQNDYHMPLALSFEVKTVSHVFQITVSNSNRILNQELYYNPVKNPFNEGFFLGFNLQKFFYFRK